MLNWWVSIGFYSVANFVKNKCIIPVYLVRFKELKTTFIIHVDSIVFKKKCIIPVDLMRFVKTTFIIPVDLLSFNWFLKTNV